MRAGTKSNSPLDLRWALQCLAIFAVYAVAHSSARMWLDRENYSLMWLPAGVGVAVLVAVPRRRWLVLLTGFALINFCYNVERGTGVRDCVVFMVASLAELAAAALLLRQWLKRPGRFERVSDAIALAAAAFGASALGGAIGAAGLGPYMQMSRVLFLFNWITGHYLAIVIIAPLWLFFSAPGAVGWGRARSRKGETAACYCVAVFLTWASFHTLAASQSTLASPYVLFVVVIWAAIRLGFLETAVASAAITAAMIFTFRTETVAYALPAVRSSLESAQQFLAVLTTTGLLLSAFETRLSAESQNNEALLRTALDGIHVHDLQGKLVQCNDAFCRMLGYARGELIGMNLARIDAQWSPEELSGIFRRNAERGAVFETRHQRKDGGIINVEISATGLEIDGIQYVYCSARDITARKALEEQLRQSQKLEAVGRLAGGVAHDFNNILTGMLLNLQTMELTQAVPPDLKPSLADLTGMVRRAAGITEQLLIFARKNVMRSVPVELNALVVDGVKLVGRLLGENVAVKLAPSPAPVWVRGDPGMLQQVLLNISLNARDAMPDGGEIVYSTLVAQIEEEPAATAGIGRSGKFACLAIRDGGSGIPPEVLPRIFEPFFTTKDVGKGTGLGLAIVHSIVKQHDGWVGVDSACGRGTTFKIFLPLAPAPETAPAPAAAAPVPGGNETVLLVEDDAAVRDPTAKLLGRLGYRVTAVASIREAFATWEAQAGRFDVVVTDMMLPGGMTGLQLAADLRRRNPAVRILIMSGYNEQIMSSEAFASAGFSFLAKPFPSQELAAKLRELLG